jgi:hypothetical protein
MNEFLECGGQDLIGYCEDLCGTADHAVCVVGNGVATPECNCEERN